MPSRSTDTTADAARYILDMALRSVDGIPDVLFLDNNSKFTSIMFRGNGSKGRIGSSLHVGSAFYKNTKDKVERVNDVLNDTFRAFANGRKNDSDVWLPSPYAVFAINNSASTLGGDSTPFFIDRGALSRLPLSLFDLRNSGESQFIETVGELEGSSGLDPRCAAGTQGATGPAPHRHCLPGGRPGVASNQGVA